MFFKILDSAYKTIWVPVFGRILYKFSSLIEGRSTIEQPTYKIKDNFNPRNDPQSKTK